MVEEAVGRQVRRRGQKGPLLLPPGCALLVLNSSSVLLCCHSWQVSCKYTELDFVSRETWLFFWESEMHKLFCSVFASDVLVLRLSRHGY